MNNKTLLVHGITLLYRESQIPGLTENSSSLIRAIINSIKLPEVNVSLDHEYEIVGALKHLALEMCEAPLGHQYDPTEFQQRIRMNTMGDSDTYDALYDGIKQPLDQDALTRFCINTKRSLDRHFKEEKAKEILKKAYEQLIFKRSEISDFSRFISALSTELEPFQTAQFIKDPAIITEVNMDDQSKVENIFNVIRAEEAGTTILRTGYQGLNRMLDGGFRRGELAVIGALEHNYKTGFSLTIFKQLAMFNTPVLTNPAKKPMMVRISFEDPVKMNFQFLYQNMVENETGMILTPEDAAQVPDEEKAKHVITELQKSGYYTRILHVNPSMWTYKDICNYILQLETEGYEVHVCMVDYLLKVPTTGCDGGSTGVDLRNMYERVKNFMASRNILFITPHQLSTEAKRLIREGRQDFVREVNGGAYWAGSIQLSQVFDLEIYIHIEKVNNDAFLTVQRGKHRKVRQTPLDHLYMVLPFHGTGSILDDINGHDSTRRKVGGGTIGSGMETPWWQEETMV